MKRSYFLKQLFLMMLCITLLSSAVATPSHALTITPSPTLSKTTPEPTKSSFDTLSKQINTLKDKIASRVAELRLVEKRGFYGTVEETSGTQLTINDLNGNHRIVDVDEITKFSSPDEKGSFGLSDLNRGTVISVIGLYNKESRRTLARFITVETIPEFLNGQVSAVSTADYTIKVIGEDGKEITVDIENITKTYTYSKDEGLVKSGFSKIEMGNRVVVVGYASKKEKNRVTGARILVFPELPRNPKIVTADKAPHETGETNASTGSGKTLTPIR